MKTLLQICQYISNMPNSEFSTITSFIDITAEQLNTLNRALRIVWNETPDYNLRFASTTIRTEIGRAAYPMVSGEIKDKGVKLNGLPLQYLTNYEDIIPTDGIPYSYYVEGDNIVLVDTPNSVLDIVIKYRNKYAVISNRRETSAFTLEADTLNIPERVEDEFIDCIGNLTNAMLNADKTDEDYTEHLDQYKKSLQILKQVDSGTQENFASFIL